jgi:hypothetical protein
MANCSQCRYEMYTVSTTLPHIYINICFSKLNIEKLIVVQLVNKFPFFVKNTRGRQGLLSQCMEENNFYGANVSSDSQ